MSDTKFRDGIKPFCPVHHWRMALDPGTAKTSASYRCNYAQCNIHFADSRGYFEGTKDFGHAALQERIEAITCKNNEKHYACIVGYAKESNGSVTEEWRHWQCSAKHCDFSTRQKLSGQEFQRIPSADYDSKGAPVHQHQHTLARR
jgi:hypothetical protein